MAKKKRKTADSKGHRSSNDTNAEATIAIEGLDAMVQLKQSWPSDVESIFSAEMEQPRRQELWDLVVESAAVVCDRFAWATPDERALRILKHFDPIVEIGAGAGYWAHCMKQRGITCDAYDQFPPVTASGDARAPWTKVHRGGPEVLKEPRHAHKTLLLCYPDEFEESSESMAAQCLELLTSATVVHCGELFGDCPMLDKAPWGRTSGADFQQHLFSMFRCVLKVPLPSWPHCNDYLTVWRRVRVCTLHLPGDASESGPSDDGAAADGADGSGRPSGRDGGQTQHESARANGGDDAARTREAGAADDEDENGGQTDGDSASEGSAASGSGDAVEMVCDFRKFGLATEQPVGGWAIPPLQHLL